jgi:hypothetical protein
MPISSGPDGSTRGHWLTVRHFAWLLLALVAASFPQVITGRQTFVYRDFGIFSYPLAFHFRECFWRGEWPLWNPLNCCGVPFLAQWNTQVLYPPALFYLFLPLSWALGVFCLLHLFWGGLGMFLLAQRWTGDRLAGAFAGIVFAFSGLMLSSLIWPATMAGLGWMPWVVWLTERAWHEGGRTVLLAAGAGALQMLSGGVEAVLLTWVLLGALWLPECLRGETPRANMLVRPALVIGLIAGLSAAQLLPFFELLDNSRRQQVISRRRVADAGQRVGKFFGAFVSLQFLSRSFHADQPDMDQFLLLRRRHPGLGGAFARAGAATPADLAHGRAGAVVSSARLGRGNARL